MSAEANSSQRFSYFRVHKSWSKAGIGTCIVLEGGTGVKTTKIALDIGCTPIFDVACQANVVLISHGHVDHIGGVFGHARARSVSFSGASPPTYFLPVQFLKKLQKARCAMSEIDAMSLDDVSDDSSIGELEKGIKTNDGSKCRDIPMLPMNLVGVKPGDEIPLKLKGMEHLVIKVFGVKHRHHPAVGYCISRRVAPALKTEYIGLSKTDIRNLIQQGVNIKTETKFQPEVGYTGDTSKDGLLLPDWKNDSARRDVRDNCREDSIRSSQKHLMEAFRSPLLICELTYLEEPRHTPSKQAINKEDSMSRGHGDNRGHMCLSDVTEVFQSHFNVEKICDDNHLEKFCAENSVGKADEGAVEDDKNRETVLQHSFAQRVWPLNGIHQLPNEVYFVHFSAKYTTEQILENLSRNLAPWLFDVTHVSVLGHTRKHQNDIIVPSPTKCDTESHNDGSDGEINGVLDKFVQDNGCIALKDCVNRKN